ncbi:hypothetical protein KDL01_02630 [Actinospica durhamensis]|uniref:Uncharacterized protein n=1 Tax=Actinospica durhamensis TaxID=1508375 RepID=A0A941IRB8_9ACTN|nr:hypothetical protein [Actinospica durhamensis]MBR7832136.1 hypothetical protein [Actinospica durhamensis]
MQAGDVGELGPERALEPEDAPPQVVGCPKCRRADVVAPVPAAVRRGAPIDPAQPSVRGVRGLVVCWAVTVLMGADDVSWPLTAHLPALAVVSLFALGSSSSTRDLVRRRRRVRSGRAAAVAVWNEGWFCARCGVVYFQPGYEPRNLALHEAVRPERFRREVYLAGGYEDMDVEGKPLISAPRGPAARRWWPSPSARRARRR